MKTRLDFSKLSPNDKVCCSNFGNGEIIATLNGVDLYYPVLVDFDGYVVSYTKDGKYHENGLSTLRTGHDRFKVGEPYPDFDYVDENEIKVNDWCFVWDNDRLVFNVRKVASKTESRYMDIFGSSWDNWVKIPAGMLEQIKGLTKMRP